VIYAYKSDEYLLAQIKDSNAKALDRLFSKYYHTLCDFSFNFVKNIQLAEEAVADVFLNIWLKRGKLEVTSSLKAYLFTAVRNQSLNYLKKEKYPFDNIELADQAVLTSPLRADDFLRFEELKAELDAVLQKLPEKMRMVFKLSRIDGLTYKEIADIMAISVNTVQTHMSRAATHLSQEKINFITLVLFLIYFIVTSIS